MEQKKSHKLLGPKKSHATSQNKIKITQALRAKKNHTSSQDKQIMQPLGTKKITQPLGAGNQKIIKSEDY